MGTGISWTNETWNPLIGCKKVSAGCKNCYAMKDARRVYECMAGAISSRGDGGTEKQRATHDAYAKVLKRSERGDALPQWNGTVVELASRLSQPLRWKKPRKIFVNSMSDLFHEDVSNEFIAAVFGVMASCPQHEFQVLTKRPGRALEWFGWLKNAHHHFEYDQTPSELVVEKARDLGAEVPALCSPAWPLPNVILMASVEGQATANLRIPTLLCCPAAAHGVSYEPALGLVDFRCIGTMMGDASGVMDAIAGNWWPSTGDYEEEFENRVEDLPKLDLIIIGGESGPGARLFDVAWARSTVEACKKAGVACFVKQMGSNPVCCGAKVKVKLKHSKGADPSEWPEDLRVQEWPDLAVKP